MAWDARAIERVTGIHHTTIMNWVKESANPLFIQQRLVVNTLSFEPLSMSLS